PALLRPQIRGGGQERGLRAGTENAAGIAGFGVAAGIVAHRLAEMAAVARRRDRMEALIRSLDPDAVVFGAGAARLPNTSSIAMPGVAAEIQLVHFDLAGIAVSAGAACSSGRIEAPSVLLAMGVPDGLARTAIRVSLGLDTTDAEIDRFVAAWAALRDRTRARRCRA
ncbi:MAG: aminotransferase class V-fold PLP-dependent enzyme, partial [Alphaproteobacteria bacterium]|nr:aminotransferase class V-fold PLP-dependent enzyme [Alphaproteobacteria bacterium]